MPYRSSVAARHGGAARTARVVMAAGLATAVALVMSAGAAWAHVTVHPSTAIKGSEQELTFRVPDEEDHASTNKLEVYFPDVHVAPVASVSVQPHAGWSAQVATTQLAKPISTDDGEVSQVVTEITWTADSPAAALQPGQYDDFNISAGPLPSNVASMTFKALQHYSDGDVVRWIETAGPGEPEPAHPAPVLTLVAPPSAASGAAAPVPASASGSGSSTTAEALAIVALAVAVLGVGSLWIVVGRRERGRATPVKR